MTFVIILSKLELHTRRKLWYNSSGGIFMNGLLERLLLLLFVAAGAIWMIGPASILIILIGIIYTSLSYRYPIRRVLFTSHFLIWMMILLSVNFLLLLPLLIYEVSLYLMKKERQLFFLFGVGIVVYGMSALAGMQHSLIYLLKHQLPFMISFFLICALSIYLSYAYFQNQKMKADLIRTRDDGEEKRILLEQTNQLIRKNSENEIDMAMLNERNRIAREIHDNVGHLLTRTILQMGALRAEYKEEPLASKLNQIGQTLDESMNQVRSSVHNLHNEGFDLKEKVLELQVEFEQYSIDLEYDLSEMISKEVKYCFLAILKEAMINIKKHSNATKMNWMLREHAGFYQLMINDNGVVKGIKESGIGLHNMENRVLEQGGTIHFSIENGFRIFITIPKHKGELK